MRLPAVMKHRRPRLAAALARHKDGGILEDTTIVAQASG